MKNIISTLLLLSFYSIPLYAQEIKTQRINYRDGKTELEGFLAYDPNVKGKQSAVIVVHEWMGINDYTKKRCEQLAKMGYLAFAADVYGKGVRPANFQEAGKEAGKYKNDRSLLRQRMNAAFDWVKNHERIDANKIAVIGHCFGGMAALELARSGAALKGVVSFHGELSNPTPSDSSAINAKILICHGVIDPYVPIGEVEAFMKEMNDAKVDYQFIAYSNAVHAFTNPAAGDDISKGVAYNKVADVRSWEAMKLFFQEIFK